MSALGFATTDFPPSQRFRRGPEPATCASSSMLAGPHPRSLGPQALLTPLGFACGDNLLTSGFITYSRVAANGAAPPGAEPTPVTSALEASTGWGCSRTGPAKRGYETACSQHHCHDTLTRRHEENKRFLFRVFVFSWLHLRHLIIVTARCSRSWASAESTARPASSSLPSTGRTSRP